MSRFPGHPFALAILSLAWACGSGGLAGGPDGPGGPFDADLDQQLATDLLLDVAFDIRQFGDETWVGVTTTATNRGTVAIAGLGGCDIRVIRLFAHPDRDGIPVYTSFDEDAPCPAMLNIFHLDPGETRVWDGYLVPLSDLGGQAEDTLYGTIKVVFAEPKAESPERHGGEVVLP